MSLLDLKDKFLKTCFKPETERGIKRLQYFWAISLGLGLLSVCYVGVTILFDKGNQNNFVEKNKIPPKVIEDPASKSEKLSQAYQYKVEEDMQKLGEEVTALKTLFQEGAKAQENSNQAYVQELETKLLQMEMQLENQGKTTQTLEGDTGIPYPNHERSDGDGKVIQKFTLSLIGNSNSKHSETVDTSIPAGAFAKTMLLSGLDASASMNASSDPRPMLLRIIHSGTLPRRFESDLKDCHCTASAYGDLSSERVYARLEKLSCIERESGRIVETQVAGYITGSDGKAGVRGVVASQDGKFLSRSLLGGIFSGLSNVANPQNRQAQVNPFFPGSPQVSPLSIGETFASGMATGATSALDRLSQYYIDRAEQLQPVIQIAAGQVVDIVFTEGTAFGSDQNSSVAVLRKKNSEQRKENQQ
jgi:conjugal transfer pilus assembly protein TraB